MRVWWDGMPETVAELRPRPSGLELTRNSAEAPIDAAHIFVTERADLEAKLRQLLSLLDPAGMIWVSWPKKAAKVADGHHRGRDPRRGLPMGLVDVKVCAVDAIWSGLKLVFGKEHSPAGG